MGKDTKPDVFDGFTALTDSLIGDVKFSSKTSDDDDKDVKTDINVKTYDNFTDGLKDIKDDDDDTSDKKKTAAKADGSKTDVDNTDTDTDDDVDDTDDDTSKVDDSKTKTKDTDNLSEFEPDIAKFFQDKFSEEMGWEFGEDEKFESVKDLVDYMKDVIEISSKPNFASEEIEKINNFVKNNGKLEDYFKVSKPGGLDVDNLDSKSETDMRLAIREKLAIQGYKDDKIRKAIERYEDRDLLLDEGEEAVEFLKDYKTNEQKRLLTEAENNKREAEKQQQKFFSTVKSSVENLNEIKGFKISSKDKQELLDYIFKPDSEGVTKYQRDYLSDVKNLIESAYFTKNGDKLISSAKKTGTSDAYKDLHQKLKANKGKRHSGAGGHQDSDSSDSLANLIGKHLIN